MTHAEGHARLEVRIEFQRVRRKQRDHGRTEQKPAHLVGPTKVLPGSTLQSHPVGGLRAIRPRRLDARDDQRADENQGVAVEVANEPLVAAKKS